jgi:hypothetical protein
MSLRVRTTLSGVTGAPYLATMHHSGGGSTDAAAAATAVRNFWAAIAPSMAAPTHIVVDPEVEEFTPGTGDITAVHNTTTAAIDSSGSGEPLPWGIQAVVRWRTGVFSEGREIRGRTYIPCLTEGHNTLGVPSGALVTILETAAAALLPVLAVWQRPRDADPDHEPHPITARPGSIVPVSARSVAPSWSMLRTRRS